MEWKTRITELLSIDYPIIQGGLAYLAYAELAAAVSNAGGLGQITAMSLDTPEDLRKEIRKLKTLTHKPYGVNFAIGAGRRPYAEMVQAALDEKVEVISITGGNPKGILDQIRDYPVKSLVLVAEKRQAEKAAVLGADAVMVVGQEGGGHIGRNDTGSIVLTPQIAEHIHIPVVASGGFVDGKGLMAALALGAEGIEMGTRFIATKECIHAHEKYKQAIMDADETSTVVIKRELGTPARALANTWTEAIIKTEQTDPTYEALKELISGKANRAFIHKGNETEGFGWAGQGAARMNEILTVHELITSMIDEAEAIRTRWK